MTESSGPLELEMPRSLFAYNHWVNDLLLD
jgi:hypothetical protein